MAFHNSIYKNSISVHHWLDRNATSVEPMVDRNHSEHKCLLFSGISGVFNICYFQHALLFVCMVHACFFPMVLKFNYN